MRPNRLRQKLQAGEITVGTRMSTVSPALVELVGHTGAYDYVEFLAEFGSFDLHDLDNFCRAAELYGMGSMIKVDQSHQAFLAQRGVGAGFESVLFTDCRSVEDVQQCVRLVSPDTPDDRGLYGVAPRRNALRDASSDGYVQVLQDTVVAIMIEKKGAVDNLEKILSVPGVDMVQWGPGDFSMSLGRAGEFDHPEVAAAKNKVFKTALKMGVAPRAEIHSAYQAKEYLDMGVRHFSLGVDSHVLFQWWKASAEQLREIVSGS